MRRLLAFVLLVLLAATQAAHADNDIRQEAIRFAPGASKATIKDTIKGSQTVDYQLRTAAGQTMTVAFKPSNPSAYFNVLPPGSDEALFIGSSAGNDFTGVLPTAGLHTIRVFLMRNAARRNETTHYTLDVSVTGGAR